jgi:hypothetical protein
MRFALHHTQATKGVPFADALVAAGHAHSGHDAEVFLVDLDIEPFRGLYDHRLANGAKVMVIPHGPNANYIYDGIMGFDPRVTAHFTIGEGQREVMRRIGMTVPTHAVGWPWCERLPFRASAAPRRVVFAPNHPIERNGFLPDGFRKLHGEIFEALLALDVELTVRHIGDLAANGLWEAPGVTYERGATDNTYAAIDSADAVVAIGTFAALAIARGVPTVMFAQDVTPWNQAEDDGPVDLAENWDAYRDYVRYPHDVADGPIGEVLAAAAASDEGIREWRDLFLGPEFDPATFAQLVEELGRDALLDAHLRSEVHIAFADEIAARPDLLADYAGRVGPDTDATLVLYAPGAEVDDVVGPLQAAIDAAGLDDARTPDMLVVAIAGHEVHERALAARAAGLLSERPVEGPLSALPRVRHGDALAA